MIQVRRTLAGEFVCVSRHLLQDLIELGLWSPELKNKIIAANGSIAGLEEIPEDIRALYKTVWEGQFAHANSLLALTLESISLFESNKFLT